MKKLYYGGNIITMEREGETVEAVLVEGGQIVRLGASESLLAEVDQSVEKIDLAGQTMLPGFIDPHGHISMAGTMSTMANLRECSSFEEIKETVKAYMEEEERDLVIGFGYDHNFLKEEAHPTKEILNTISTRVPILLLHISGHIGCCNDVALQLAGIGEDSVAPEGGTIGRLAGGNEPNGYLEETALNQAQAAIFKDVEMDHVKLFLEGQESYLEQGITTAQDGATGADTWKLLDALAGQGLLKLDIIAYPPVEEIIDGMTVEEKYIQQYSGRLKVGGYKLFLDGSPQGKTAWMSEPYEGEETYRGYARYTDEAVEGYVRRAVDDGMQLLTHCNGDAASEQLIEAYKTALDASPYEGKEALRPVMIHCQTTREDQLRRMKEIEMIPSIFIGHTYYWGDVHLKNLGEKRGHRISPANTAFKEGLVVNFHQDTPVTEPDMLHTIWCAVNRQTRKGQTVGAEEAVSVYEALQAVTSNAAYAYFEEDEKGTIAVGKVADFVVLDANPFEVEPMKLKDIAVTETIKSGESVYRR